MFNLFNHIHDNISTNSIKRNFNNISKSNYSFISSIFNEINLSSNKKDISYCIDRIENSFAVCESINTNEFTNISLTKLPNNIKEGDIVKLFNNMYIIDKNETLKRKENIEDKIKNLWKRNP